MVVQSTPPRGQGQIQNDNLTQDWFQSTPSADHPRACGEHRLESRPFSPEAFAQSLESMWERAKEYGIEEDIYRAAEQVDVSPS